MRKSLYYMGLLVFFISCRKAGNENETYTGSVLVLDWDSGVPIAGVKVYSSVSSGVSASLEDSTLTDMNGRAGFTYTNTGQSHLISILKGVYESPGLGNAFIIGNNVDVFDTLFLARPSILNLTLHNSGGYTNTDSLRIDFSGYRLSAFLFTGMNKMDFFYFSRKAQALDTVLSIPSVYFAPPYQKIYMDWTVVRNGINFSSGSDSTDLVQFSAKNHLLNY